MVVFFTRHLIIAYYMN